MSFFRGGPSFQLRFPFIATREGFLLHRKLVLCAVDQHTQRICGAIRTDAGDRVNLTGAGFEAAAAVHIHPDGDIASVLRHFHIVCHILPCGDVEQSRKIDLVALDEAVIDDRVGIAGTRFTRIGGERIGFLSARQDVIADAADQDVIAVAADQ